ncbi:HCO3-cotransp domain-containing protein [Aphelenchoides fujianensis]|nr:HCO3-cotransp domain-containing protein [Aphelenchoides fujianensis]
MCAAAVQSLAHCSSLTVMKKKAPGAKMGEFPPLLARIILFLLSEVEKVHEQRVTFLQPLITTILISLLMGLFAFAGSYLRLPLASLFGVFFYLGVMNLCGVQLMHRIVLFFVPAKYFPQKPYTELVGVWRMHSFTIIQIGLLLFVYIVKHFKRTALLFPFVLMLFIVFRQLVMPKIFSEKELKALDGEDDEEQEWCDDFNYQAPIPV